MTRELQNESVTQLITTIAEDRKQLHDEVKEALKFRDELSDADQQRMEALLEALESVEETDQALSQPHEDVIL